MTLAPEPLHRLTHEAIEVLVRELGVARTLRFLAQFRTGAGDYTAERQGFLPNLSLEELFAEGKRLDDQAAEQTP